MPNFILLKCGREMFYDVVSSLMMTIERKNIFISESIGPVSGELMTPDTPSAVMTLAHGAGAGMDHPFMKALALELSGMNIASLRFNFSYMERGKKRPDVPAIAHKTIEAVVGEARRIFPQLPLILAGKSFGGRMSSQLVALQPQLPVSAIVFYGFPLHPANTPSVVRAEHLSQIRVPLLFLQGTRDALAQVNLITEVCEGLPSATLSLIDGADHSFKVGKKDNIVDLARKTHDYLLSHHII